MVGYCHTVIAQEGDSITLPGDALSGVIGAESGGLDAISLDTDDAGNIIYAWYAVGTYPPENQGDPPIEKQVVIVVYNGDLVLTEDDLIDQNNDGVINANDFGATFKDVQSDLNLTSNREAWFIGDGHLSVGDREVVIRLHGLPNTTNPWIDACNESPCEGDVDGDGKVDQADLGILLASFDMCQGDNFYDDRADLDGDNCVGQTDLGILLAEYNVCGF